MDSKFIPWEKAEIMKEFKNNLFSATIERQNDHFGA